ncbi:CatB-related O-acetyltransferase [Seonamhaeicola algicola]|uniref:CatB-related O-acetyltransferase n=1 Tax=Seonamhaeicola algicola TaxID=1719036 RepID=A0A5C7ASG0_9FLAO|nr:CatB-related O-acetyltransferase [Seonamhaeicola algicola]TXE11658.1 CatB-related O-acetyltransferase [Seonamhaeicola algicola]
MIIAHIRNYLWRLLGVDYNHTLSIHDYVFLKRDKYTTMGTGTYNNGALVFRWTKAPLKIGNYCSIANNVRFIVDEGYHKASPITNFPLVNNLFKDEITLKSEGLANNIINNIKQKEGITIGNDVWIGMGAFIMPGVTIGNGVTIAANAVVTKNIPDYHVVAGVPAKTTKIKYDDETISNLNKIAWWNWDKAKIKDNIGSFYSTNVKEFISKYK